MKFAVLDAANVTLYSKKTNKPLYHTRDINTFNLNFTGDTIFAKAKGKNAVGFDSPMEGTLTMEAEVIGFDELAVILASEMVEESARVGQRKLLKTDSSKKVTLGSVIPVQGSMSVFEVENDKVSHKRELQFTAVNSAGSTEITITTADFVSGKDVVVYYLQDMPNCKTISIKDNSVAPNYYMYADTYVKDKTTGESYVMAMKLPNLKAKRSIELNLTAENPSVFKTEFAVLSDENNESAKFSFIGDNAEGRVASLLNADTISFGDDREIQVKKAK